MDEKVGGGQHWVGRNDCVHKRVKNCIPYTKKKKESQLYIYERVKRRRKKFSEVTFLKKFSEVTILSKL